MNVNPAYNNFTAGELSPKMNGRSDTQQYFNGAKRIENFIIETQGGLTYRNGFEYISGTKDNKPAFIWRFEFSDEIAYILEFTEFNVRIYRDKAVVVDGSANPIDVVTEYAFEDLFQLKFTQDGKNLYIAHNNYKPRKLVREDAVTWSLDLFEPTGFTPSFADRTITAITQANPAVVTYVGDDSFFDGQVLKIDDVVGMVELNGDTYEIQNLNDVAKTFELKDVDSSAFNAYVSDGTIIPLNEYPAACGFYEQRLIFGGSNSNVETLWFSKSGVLDDFTVGVEADDGLKYTVIAGETTNKVEWIKGTEGFLAIGGFGDLLKATGGQGEEAITPTTISIKPTNTYGSADINPIGKKQTVMFTQRNQLTVHSLELEDITGVYKPVDRNIFADHITKGGITQMAYQTGRPDVLWATRSDGVLLGLTIAIEQQVSGWHRHSTNGEFVSVATTPRDKEFDLLWACVKRTVNGVDTYSIEVMSDNPVYPDREDFITGREKSDEAGDSETFQSAMYEAQKKYIHLDGSATFDGSIRTEDASATLTVSAVTGAGITLTASNPVFTSSDVGNQVWVKSVDGTRRGRAEITAYTNNSNVTADVLVDFDSTDVYQEWYITASEITGLDHLEGETVSIVVDGSIHVDRVVSSGAVILDGEASVAHIGFGYEGTMETMNLDGGSRTGTSQTKKMSVAKVGVRFLNSSGFSFGTSYYNLEDRQLRRASDLLDNPPPLFTGDEILRFRDGHSTENAGWSRQKRVIIKQVLALPVSLQLLTPYFVVSDVD